MLDFPSSPTLNQQFSSGLSTWSWDGTAWNVVPQMTPAVASDTPPANPAIGQGWWRGTNGKYYLWLDDGNSKQWVEIGGGGAIPGAWETIGGGIINLTGLNSYAWPGLSPFRSLRMRMDFTPSAGSPYLRVSNDNGATWVQLSNSYYYSGLGQGGTVVGGVAQTFTSSIALTLGASAANVQQIMNVELSEFNRAAGCLYKCSVFRQTGTPTPTIELVYGADPTAVARNALQFGLTTGTFTNGIALLEGLRA